MTIASSSGLSEKDIEKMVSDTEQFAETDKALLSLIKEANKADIVWNFFHSIPPFRPLYDILQPVLILFICSLLPSLPL